MLEWLEKTNTRGKIMENIIIIGVIIILLVVGLRSTKKHFKGEGGCCGGGSKPIEVPEKKLDICGHPGALYLVNGRAFFCCTASAKSTVVLEYPPEVITEETALKILRSIFEPVE